MSLLPVALLLVVSLAACLQKPATPSVPTQSTELPLPRALHHGFQFLNCTQVLLPFEAPQAAAASVIPAAFQPHGITPGTVRVNSVAAVCPRSTSNESVLGPTRHYWTFAFAEPKNHSWRQEGYISYYVLDYTTDSEEFIGRLAGLGIRIEKAAIDTSSGPFVTGGRSVEWTARTSNFTHSFQYVASPDNPQWTGGYFHLWFGATQFRRVDLHSIYHVETSEVPGTFSHEGKSRLGEILKSPVLAWDGTSTDDHTNLWSVDEMKYCLGDAKCNH